MREGRMEAGDYTELKHNALCRVKNLYSGTADVNCGIASYITAYGRMRLHEFESDIQKHGGRVFYKDTDSAITDLDFMTIPALREKWVFNENPDQLGSMKSERGLSADGSKSLPYDRFIGAGSKVYYLSDSAFFERTYAKVSE